MTDPGSSMSLTAVIVLTVVVLVGMAGWLGAVFFAAREPRDGSARPGGVSGGYGQRAACARGAARWSRHGLAPGTLLTLSIAGRDRRTGVARALGRPGAGGPCGRQVREAAG
jgi:hypothetical protein